MTQRDARIVGIILDMTADEMAQVTDLMDLVQTTEARNIIKRELKNS